MTFISHIFFSSTWLPKGLILLSGIALLAMVSVFPRATTQETFPSAHDRFTGDATFSWKTSVEYGDIPFDVMRGESRAVADTGAAFLKDFRFAGTFFLYEGQDAGASFRRGVLSYLPENRQMIVSEGEMIGEVRVTHLYEDRIVLERQGESGTLYLGGKRIASTESALDRLSRDPDEDPTDLQTSRFGQETRVGFWEMDKDALMAYYDELMDAPERLLQVFDSMQPLYNQAGDAIEGYRLEPVGEQAFFEDVGFRGGDVVRSVNSVPMTNRGRAEFFIRQVVQDRMSAIVIDIERDGEERRLVYQLR